MSEKIEKLIELEFKAWHAANKDAFQHLSPEERGDAIKWKLRELALKHRLITQGNV
jgi:hypothetical protein